MGEIAKSVALQNDRLSRGFSEKNNKLAGSSGSSCRNVNVKELDRENTQRLVN